MMERVELSTRGKKQFRDIVKSELKPLVDATIREILTPTIENRVNHNLEGLRYIIEDIVKKQVKEMYWSVMEEALKESDFQELFKNEIIQYLHRKWACGTVPFDEQFNDALMKAVKELISKGRGG